MKKLSLILFSIIILTNFSFTNSSEKNVAKGKEAMIKYIDENKQIIEEIIESFKHANQS